MDGEAQARVGGPPERAAGSPYFGGLIRAERTTPAPEIDRLLTSLALQKASWAQLGIDERIALLADVRRDLLGVSERWVEAEIRAKQIMRGSLGEAEEWVLLAAIFRALRTLERSLEAIRNGAKPGIPGGMRSLTHGQVALRAFPNSIFDRLIFAGVTGDVWMEPGLDPEQTVAAQASLYASSPGRNEGKLALILGAGNASMLPVIDLLHKQIIHHKAGVNSA